MALETSIWKIGPTIEQLQIGTLDLEKKLEDILCADIGMANPEWMVIGRQVHTGFGFVDLLCINRNGDLIVAELKKNRTPRDVIAQLLDYGSWVRHIADTDIARIFETFQAKFRPGESISLDEAFKRKFETGIPETINGEHHLVVIAASLDDSSERIVTYLSEAHGIQINAIFFRAFRDGEKEFLTRTWFADPTSISAEPREVVSNIEWNGEYYVSFGIGKHRSWNDAQKYGFISGGNGEWYSKTLLQLTEGDKVWVNIPGTGYVGYGEVTQEATKASEFRVKQGTKELLLKDLSLEENGILHDLENEALCEYVVGVKWIKTVALAEAVKEKGFFGNQNTVCRPTTKKWDHTVDRLKKRLLAA